MSRRSSVLRSPATTSCERGDSNSHVLSRHWILSPTAVCQFRHVHECGCTLSGVWCRSFPDRDTGPMRSGHHFSDDACMTRTDNSIASTRLRCGHKLRDRRLPRIAVAATQRPDDLTQRPERHTPPITKTAPRTPPPHPVPPRTSRKNSATSRDFPTPGAPTTHTRCAAPPASNAPRTTSSSRANSFVRPTKPAPVGAPPSLRRPTTRCATTASALPFTMNASAGPATIALRARERRSGDRDLALRCCLLQPRGRVRYVAIHTSHTTHVVDDLARIDSRPDPQPNTEIGIELFVDLLQPARPYPTPRTARSASSSCTTGTPNTATASPMKLRPHRHTRR